MRSKRHYGYQGLQADRVRAAPARATWDNLKTVLFMFVPDRKNTHSVVAQDAREKNMLVTFSCPAYADITMFGDVAVRLIRMMGHSGTVPSALLAADVPAALVRLELAVEAERQSPQPEESASEDDEEPAVSLPRRALPLIELLKAAARAECNVMWDSNQ